MDQLEFSPANDEDDLVLWLEQQAALLRARQFDHLDIGNIVDELEGRRMPAAGSWRAT